MKRPLLFGLGTLFCLLSGCTSGPTATSNRASADFINGDFETGDLTGWVVDSNSNQGLAVVPPTTIAQLNLQTGGSNKTFVRQGATPESQTPAGLTSADSLKYPRFGQYTTVINEFGNGGNSNHLSQVMTTTAADIDPLDGKIHVRFCLAPVLQNPGHAASMQPYFYIEVNNTTQNKQLFYSFNFSGEQGVPWKTSATGSQYTDWQLFDLTPSMTDLAPGDTVQMDVIASGCQPGGHYGHVYVDAFGSFIPGLTISALAPTFAQPGTDLVYTFQASNGGASNVDNVVVNETLPPGTTFVSVTGATCTTPMVGATGTVVCNLGTVNAGAGANFQMTVHIDAAAATPIVNGTYSILGTGVSSLLGPKVSTQLGYPLSSQVVGGNGTLSCPAGVTQGQSAVCTIAPSPGFNLLFLGLDGVDATASVVNNTYTLSNVQAAHTVTAIFNAPLYTISVATPGGNGAISCTSPVVGKSTAVCAISPATGYWLNSLSLDGSDALPMVNGTSFTIPNVTANHAVTGTFALASYAVSVSVPSGNGTINCGSPIMRGGSCSCSITPASGYGLATLTFDGADVLGQVAGNSLQINNVTASHLVQGTFQLLTNVVSISVPGGNGAVFCSSPIIYGQSAVCSITPAEHYRLRGLALDGNDVTAQVSNSTFTIQSLIAPATLSAVFELIPLYEIISLASSGNGTVLCKTPVAEGTNSTCLMVPADGYEIDAVALDGVDAHDLVQGTALNLYGVTAEHTIFVNFKKARATACTSNDQCHSGFCADGVCCDRACDGQCEACNTPAATGACSPVTSGASPAGHPACGFYMCGEGGCQVECESDAECAAGSVCSSHACIAGEHRLTGGGIGCAATGMSGNAATDSSLLVLALFALLTRRRGRQHAA